MERERKAAEDATRNARKSGNKNNSVSSQFQGNRIMEMQQGMQMLQDELIDEL